MIVIAAGLLLLAFLVYGVLQIGRLRREDPAGWPEVAVGSQGARLRLHPAWHVETKDEGLEIRPGVTGATLSVSWVSAAGLPLTERLSGLVASGGAVLDRPEVERFENGRARGARVASAATLPDGERRWLECYLIEGPRARLFLSYRCPVLSGSVDSLTLSRAAGTVEFD